MTQPLALVLYEKLLPGSQLANKLQDINYRVQSLTDPNLLVECAQQATPLIVLVDIDTNRPAIESAIRRLKQNASTAHLPVIAFTSEAGPVAIADQGPTLIVNEAALLAHLPQFLDQALQIE